MGKTVEKRKKKKGRPSLLDLQKRSLRLQKQQQQQEQQQQQQQRRGNPNPTPNPYLRFPNSSAPTRRPTRRNPNPQEEEGDDDDESSGNRREKKLKLVLRLPPNNNGSNKSADSKGNRSGSGSDSSGSESEAGGETPLKKRKIDAVVGDGSALGVREKAERHNSALKATDPPQGGEPSDPGPTTPLPDKKLLVFILDRLQKKDTYGVFSEPVDPNELPDYHEVIEHPMDFTTVRKKLSVGVYSDLEQFENDVFLISTNAMRYNAPDTIYFRQARSIHELAKKNFENLRQESDDNEPEPKTVRRGRPPSKNTIKRAVGRPPADRTGSDFSSDATLANARDNSPWSNSTHDLLRKGSTSDKADFSTRTSYGLRYNETYNWMAEHKSERNEEYSGSVKGVPGRYGKKVCILDENRRNTYKQPQPSVSGREPSILTAFDGEKKQLVPVGLHMEHSYARSLARFAANLGPVGWEIAEKKIERVLPPGTMFGQGWVGENDVPKLYQPPLLSTSPQHPFSQPESSLQCSSTSRGDGPPERPETQSNILAVEEGGHSSQMFPPSVPVPNRSSNSMEGCAQGFRGLSSERGFRPKAPFHLHQNPTLINGMTGAFGFNLPSQVGKMSMSVSGRPTGSFASEVEMTHARALDMVSRGSNSFILESEKPNMGISGVVNSGSITFTENAQDMQGHRRGLSLNQKPDSTPPDLNVRFQSPGSPASSVLVDPQQQPDLALQL